MKRKPIYAECYALLWRSLNKHDGLTEFIVREYCVPMLFSSQKAVIAYREARYGYYRTRPDLRREPNGWMIPRVVKVRVEVTTR